MDADAREKVVIAFRRKLEEEGVERVTAVGAGSVAEKIEELARREGIEIEEDPGEIEKIFRFQADQVIPPRVYALITELINFTFQLREVWKEKNVAGGGDD